LLSFRSGKSTRVDVGRRGFLPYVLATALLLAGPLLHGQAGEGGADSPPPRTARNARTDWNRESSAISSLLRKADGLERTLRNLDEQIDKRSQEERDLIREKDLALDDLRQGRFCSKCSRSATE